MLGTYPQELNSLPVNGAVIGHSGVSRLRGTQREPTPREGGGDGAE